MTDDQQHGLERVEDLLRDRMRGGTLGIHARDDAVGVLRREVGVRKRRRRAAGAVAVLATVAAVAVPAAVLTSTDDRTDPPVAGTSTPAATASPTETAERPAAFFVSLVGGGSRAKGIIFRPVPSVKKLVRFLWYDNAEKAGAPVHAGIGIERIDLGPEAGCRQLVAASGGECVDVGDGSQARVLDTTAAVARMAPFHEVGPLNGPMPDDLVRSVTVVRADGWAVSILVCACAPGVPDLAEPPLAADVLVAAAADARWVAAS